MESSTQPDNNTLYCINCTEEKLIKVQCSTEIIVDQCPTCKGLWLDSGELVTLLKIGEFYINNLDSLKNEAMTIKQGKRDCPICHVPLKMMTNNKAPDVKIDRCEQCKGVWLDPGELFKLGKLYKKT